VTAVPFAIVKLEYHDPGGDLLLSRYLFSSMSEEPSRGSMVESCSVQAPLYQIRLRSGLELLKYPVYARPLLFDGKAVQLTQIDDIDTASFGFV
jgi:hypothetical protein